MTSLKFELDEIFFEGAVLWGRNGTEQLPVGTFFSRAVKERICDSGLHEVVDSMTVQIVVTEIEIWRKSVPFALAGHTAGLRVKGLEREKLVALLRSRLAHELVYLQS